MPQLMSAIGSWRPQGVLHVAGGPVGQSVNRAARLSGRRLGVALMYHRVGDPPGDPAGEIVPALGTAAFESHVRHVRRRYRLVHGSRLLDEVAGRRRGEAFPVALTFDDDDPGHVLTVLPVLRRAG